MRRFLFACTLLAGFGTLVTTGASAQSVYDGVRAEDMQRIVAGMGYRAQIKESKSGAPFISSAANGLDFSIAFPNCQEGQRCRSMTFQTWWKPGDRLDLRDLNEWNTKRRYTTAFRRTDGGLGIRMDVSVDGGVTEKYLENVYKGWSQFLDVFDGYRKTGKF